MLLVDSSQGIGTWESLAKGAFWGWVETGHVSFIGWVKMGTRG